MSKKKTIRNRMIFDCRRNNPQITYREIGEMFGITKNRVIKIVQTVGKESSNHDNRDSREDVPA